MFRFSPTDEVQTFAPEVEVRAVIEGQVMAKLVHAQRLGYEITPSSRVLVTGGASQNQHICQVCPHGVWPLSQEGVASGRPKGCG